MFSNVVPWSTVSGNVNPLVKVAFAAIMNWSPPDKASVPDSPAAADNSAAEYEMDGIKSFWAANSDPVNELITTDCPSESVEKEK